MKKYILWNTLFLFFIGILPIFSYASDIEFTYQLDANNNAIITAYHGSSSNITIPNEIDGHLVKSIGEHAFDENRNTTNGKILSHITINEGITSISDYAFVDCDNLESVTLPESITSLGSFTFLNCRKLNKINIPSNLKRLEEFVFQDTGFTEFVIPEGFEYIGISAFRSCKNLTRFIVNSDNVTYFDNTKESVFDPETNQFVTPEPKDVIFEYCSNPITFYGNENSTTKAYANLHNFQFKLLSDIPSTPVTPPNEPSFDSSTKDETVTNTNKNLSNALQNKKADTTISNKILPRAGSTYFILLLALMLLIITILFYKNYKNSKDF